jgi:hypothetical protein
MIESSASETTLIIAGVASITALAVIIYASLKIDWSKIIGKWFPWALEDDNNDNGEKKEDGEIKP